MNLQKRILYTIKIDNVVDIITNSSSELFVLDGETDSIVKEMISNIYPDYLYEYEELKDVRTMTAEELNNFLDWHLGLNGLGWNAPNRRAGITQEKYYKMLPGFNFEEIYDIEKGLNYGSYEVRNNIKDSEKVNAWDNSFVTDDNKTKVIKGIEESVGRFFLYSIDENPNWEYQEKLIDISTHRYHLG